MMAEILDLGLYDKLQGLAQLFKNLCSFPVLPSAHLTRSETAYVESVERLFRLDAPQLDRTADETYREWELETNMADKIRDRDDYMVEFTKRLDVAREAVNEDLFAHFASSELGLTEDETAEDQRQGNPSQLSILNTLGKGLEKIDSFATTFPGSPIFSDDYDEDDASSMDSPVASMERMGMSVVLFSLVT